MIPYLEIPGETPPILPATDEEAFISQANMARALHEGHVEINTGLLWRSIVRNEGIHLDNEGQVQGVKRGSGLYSVRLLGEEPLLSVDGLVNGIADGELRSARKIGHRSLAAIGYLGIQFVPERENDVRTGLANDRNFGTLRTRMLDEFLTAKDK